MPPLDRADPHIRPTNGGGSRFRREELLPRTGSAGKGQMDAEWWLSSPSAGRTQAKDRRKEGIRPLRPGLDKPSQSFLHKRCGIATGRMGRR